MEDKTNDKKETETPSKGPIMAIFVVLGLLLIGYAIYMFEAYKNNMWPMVKFGPPIGDKDAFNDYFTIDPSTKDPSGAIRPLGYMEKAEPSDDQTTAASDVLGQVCTWYAQSPKDYLGLVPLPCEQLNALCAKMPGFTAEVCS